MGVGRLANLDGSRKKFESIFVKEEKNTSVNKWKEKSGHRGGKVDPLYSGGTLGLRRKSRRGRCGMKKVGIPHKTGGEALWSTVRNSVRPCASGQRGGRWQRVLFKGLVTSNTQT